MIVRRFARPYAKAIIDVAGSAENANKLRGELMAFDAALRKSTDLTNLYANPGIELNAKLVTGFPSLLASVSTATTEVVISEKSMLEFLMSEATGTAHSRISRIRIDVLYPIKGFVALPRTRPTTKRVARLT